jgi:hypothetical protein
MPATCPHCGFILQAPNLKPGVLLTCPSCNEAYRSDPQPATKPVSPSPASGGIVGLNQPIRPGVVAGGVLAVVLTFFVLAFAFNPPGRSETRSDVPPLVQEIEDLARFIRFLVIYEIIAATFCGLLVGERRERGLAGAALGFFFGPLGVLAAFALDARPRCPQCCIRVERPATVCPGCGLRFARD